VPVCIFVIMSDLEYVLYVGVDRKAGEFIGNKHTHSLTQL